MPSDALMRFHCHLDVCARCREQPFNLCVEGLRLLLKANDEALSPFRSVLTKVPPWGAGEGTGGESPGEADRATKATKGA